MTPLFKQEDIRYFPNPKGSNVYIADDYWELSIPNSRKFKYSTGHLLKKHNLSRHQLLSIITETSYVKRPINCDVCSRISVYSAYTRAEACNNKISVDRIWDRNVCENCRRVVNEIELKHAQKILKDYAEIIDSYISDVEVAHQSKYVLYNAYNRASVYSNLANCRDLLNMDNAFAYIAKTLSDLNLLVVEKTAYGRITDIKINGEFKLPIKHFAKRSTNFPREWEIVPLSEEIKSKISYSENSDLRPIIEPNNNVSLSKTVDNKLSVFIKKSTTHRDMKSWYLSSKILTNDIHLEANINYSILAVIQDDGIEVTMVPTSELM